MIRVLRSVAVGVAAASLLLLVTDLDGDAAPWTLSVSTALAILLSVLIGLVRGFSGLQAVTVADLDAADREHRVSLAKILDTRATGSSINDQPLCEIRLIVAPRTRAAYETTTRALVNLGRLPSMQRGAVVVVAQASADRPEVALVDDPPGAWQRQADQDTTVRALESAPVWETPAKPGRDARGFVRIPAVVLLLIGVLAFAGRLYPARETLLDIARGASLAEARDQAEQRRDEAASIFPADRTAAVIDDLVAAAGVTEFSHVLLTQTYATADARTSADADTIDEYMWRHGSVEHRGAASIQPDADKVSAIVFDVTAIDWSVIETLTAQVADLTGIADPDGPGVQVQRPTDLDMEIGDWVYGDVQIRLNVSDDYRDGAVVTDASGQIISMSGGAPGSPAAEWAAANG